MKTSHNDKLSFLLFIIILLTIGCMLYASKTGEFEQHKSWVFSVAVSNRNTIISASNNELLLWNNRHCTDRLASHTDAIKSVSFSHNGLLFASGSIDKTVKIWSSTTRSVIKTLTRHTAGVNKVEFDVSDKYLVSAGYDDRLFIWDVGNGTAIKEFDIKNTDFSISRSDVLAYVDTTCTLRLFDLSNLTEMSPLGQYCGTPLFHPTKNIIAVKDPHKSVFNFIDIASAKIVSQLSIIKPNSESQVSVFTFTPDGEYLLAGIWGGAIEIWDWQRKKLINTLQGRPLTSIDALLFNNKNELLSGSGDRSVKIWNWQNGRLIASLGDGGFEADFSSFLAVIILLTLISAFFAIRNSTANIFSSVAIFSILSIWSCGIFLICYFLKSYLKNAASVIMWIFTSFTCLFFVSVYGAWLSLFTIPIALTFGYIQIVTAKATSGTSIAILANLFFIGLLCTRLVPV
jgi:WD40 repeat protein